MTHGSLFSGIGGFDLAAQWMGWENIFHCEWNEFGQKILKHYWPKSISYGDITKTDFTIHRGRIDILTGGFPCQPYSSAGKRLGKADDRHLWPEMLRAIREIQPRWIVGENVRGLTNWNGGMVFDEVQSDLEAQGYEVTPFLLPACAVNAPHRRDRIWFVAYLHHNGHATAENGQGMGAGNDSDQTRKDKAEQLAGRAVSVNVATDPTQTISKCALYSRAGGSGITGVCGGYDSNSNSKGLQRRSLNGGTSSGRKERNKQPAGCIPSTWNEFPTQPPVCSGNDGLSAGLAGITFSKHRNESIKAYGNAVVPQVVHQIFKAIQQYEATTKP
jgi:DNA (cytosine-5)-methyltransferase 1